MAGSQGTEYSYIGKGSVSVREKGTATPLRPIGNVDSLSLKATEEKKELKDFQNAGGGNANSLRRIQAVELSMSIRDFVGENIAMAVFGSSAAVAGSNVLNEAVVAYLGGLTPLAHIAPTAVTVTNVAGTTTYVAGTDYEVTTGGIWIPTGSTIPDAATIHVDYTWAAQTEIQALVNAGKDWEFYFSGLNEAQSGKAVVVKVHRARFGPIQDFALIGDDYAAMALDGDCLKDTGITGAGLSQYFKVTYV